MSLAPGSTLNHYRIESPLGTGGMGQVYVATDTRLGRQIALKVLSPEFTDVEERVQRFQREARVVAALNHPNIVTLHSIEEDDGHHFLTMELVEGKTLGEIIPARGLPIERFFDIAIPLAEAVAAAHARGVTHRDLKPNNVMVTPKGQVKVLDFGLAKLMSGAGFIGDEAATLLDTGAGRLVGTVTYMSPEQAEGGTVDARSDIFSLGVLLYEVLLGEPPFTGHSAASIITSILRDIPPPARERRHHLPRQLDRILGMCLAKEPDRRFQSALDLRNALEALREELQDPYGDDNLFEPSTRRRWPALAAMGLIGAGAALAAQSLLVESAHVDTRPRLEGAGIELYPMSREGQLSDFPSWSPDGRWLLYTSDRGGNMDLWRIRVGGGEPEQLTTTAYDEREPTYSPAGGSMAFVADIDGEPAIYLADEDASGTPTLLWSPAANPAWSPDGKRLAFDWAGSVYVIRAGAGAAPLGVLDGTAGSPHPAWSARGDALYIWNWVVGDVQYVPIDDRPPRALGLVPTGQEVASLDVSPTGDELLISRGQYGGNKDIWSVPLDIETGMPTGDATRLTYPFTDDRHAAFSPAGDSVAFSARRVERHLWNVPLDDATGLLAGPAGAPFTWAAPLNYYPSITKDGGRVIWTAHPGVAGLLFTAAVGAVVPEKVTSTWGNGDREVGGSFAPDGERLVYSRPVGTSYVLWRTDCVRCVALPMTENQPGQRDSLPAWSPVDGGEIAFMSTRSGSWDIWTIGVDRGAQPAQLTSMAGAELYPSWHPDGGRVAFRSQQAEGTDLWQVELATGEATPLVQAPGQEAWGMWHPDGTRFYYTSNRNGAFNIWMVAEGSEPVRVTAYDGLANGLPEVALYTKFAVSRDHLVLPIENRKGEIWVMHRKPREGASP